MTEATSFNIAELDAPHGDVHEAHAGAEHPKASMPQLDFSTYPSQIFWLLLGFGVFYLLISRSVLPRIHEVMDRRFHRLERDLARAQELAEEAEQSKAEYEALARDARHNANLMMERAVKEQEVRAEEVMHQADAQAEQMMEQSYRAMQEKRDAMKQQFSDLSESVAVALIEELTRMTPDVQKVRTALSAMEK